MVLASLVIVLFWPDLLVPEEISVKTIFTLRAYPLA
jgi:hypothetical protein